MWKVPNGMIDGAAVHGEWIRPGEMSLSEATQEEKCGLEDNY